MADIFGVVKSGDPPVPTNGATIKAWAPSQVPGGVLPPENTAEPGGTPAGSAVSGTNYGSDGAFLITGLSSGTYLVSWTLNSTTYWAEFQALRSTPGFDHIFINDTGGISVGETTDKVGTGNSGAWITGMGHFTNDLWGNAANAAQQWGPNTRNPGVWLSNDGTNLYGIFQGHDNVAYGTALLGTSFNPFVLMGYHNANNAPQMNQIGYGLRFQTDTAGINFAQGKPGTAPGGAGTAPDWANEPRFWLQPTLAGSGDAWSGRMNLRCAHLKIGPNDGIVRQANSGLFSALFILERGADANDASIIWRSYLQNQAYFTLEMPGTNNLHVKKITGQQNNTVNPPTSTEAFESLAWFQYTTGFLSVGTDDGTTPQGQLYVRSRHAADRAFVVDTVASPTANAAEFRINGGAANWLLAPNGRIGVGNPAPATPATQFHFVQTDIGFPRGFTIDQFSSSPDSVNITGRKARGTPASPAVVLNGDPLYSLSAAAYDGAAYQNVGFAEWVVNGTVAAGSVPSDFVIGTGATNFGSERLRLASTGHHKLTGDLTVVQATNNGVYGGIQIQHTADTSNDVTGLISQTFVNHASGTLVNAFGLDVWHYYQASGTGTVTNQTGVRATPFIAGNNTPGSIGSLFGFCANRPQWAGTGTPNLSIGTQYGLFVDDMAASPHAGVTINGSYGIFIAAQSNGHYALRVDGNSPTYFGGPVEFHNQSTAPTAGAQGGYVIFQINGNNVKIPWYNM